MNFNLLITGDRNQGKTTLVSKIIKNIKIPYDGFITKPDKHYPNGTTYIMEDLITKETAAISRYIDNRIIGYSATFSDLGVRCLNRCLYSSVNLIVMDELGRFEKNNLDFIEKITDLLDSKKTVIAVLKAEPIEYLDKIKARKDCIIYDLNQIDTKDVYDDIISKLSILI